MAMGFVAERDFDFGLLRRAGVLRLAGFVRGIWFLGGSALIGVRCNRLTHVAGFCERGCVCYKTFTGETRRKPESKALTQRTQRKTGGKSEKAEEILHPRSRVQDDDARRVVMRAWPGRWRRLGPGAFSFRAWLSWRLLLPARRVCLVARPVCPVVRPACPALRRARLAARRARTAFLLLSLAVRQCAPGFRRFFPGCGPGRPACRLGPFFSARLPVSAARRSCLESSRALFPSARPAPLVLRRALPVARTRPLAACLALPVDGPVLARERRNPWPV